MSQRPPLAVVILAAGHGTRMSSRRAKVLHEIAGDRCSPTRSRSRRRWRPSALVVVIGRDADQIEAALAGRAQFVVQAEPRGTGHAVQTALPDARRLRRRRARSCTATCLCSATRASSACARSRRSGRRSSMLTSPEPLPGLVVRGADGRVERIVESDRREPRGARHPRGQHRRLPGRLRPAWRARSRELVAAQRPARALSHRHRGDRARGAASRSRRSRWRTPKRRSA